MTVVAEARFFKGLDQKNQYREFKRILPVLRKRLAENPEYLKLPDDKRKELRDGRIYVSGLRDAARIAGWDVSHFDAMHTYLSMQSDTAPMSFQRMDEQIDF